MDIVCVGVLGTDALYTIDSSGRRSIVIDVTDAEFHADAGQVNHARVQQDLSRLRKQRQPFWAFVELQKNGGVRGYDAEDLRDTIVPIEPIGVGEAFDPYGSDVIGDIHFVPCVIATKVVVGRSLRAEAVPPWLVRTAKRGEEKVCSRT